jgi:catechol 2,3-dioxygenase-like lactoylglutathione lyase family enzyme
MEDVMYDHIGLRTSDLVKSSRFYSAALEPLGLKLAYEDESTCGFGAAAAGLYISQGRPGAGVHIAFAAASRAAVDGFHTAGLEGGGRDNGRPGIRADYGPNYYAAYLLDPDGNNVEAVCLN